MQYLRDNPALVEEISRKVLEKRGLLGTPAPESAPAPEPAPAPTPRKRAAAASGE
jgi:hypothetical protein